MPLVSVLCPTYNRSAAIRATINSVLQQSFTDFELIVVSDGSTDDTDEHVAAAARDDGRVRLLRIDHSGHPSRAINAGMAEAVGAVVAYIDHDDFWTPEHLDVINEQLEAGADLVATNSVWICPEGRLLSRRPAAALFWHHDIQVMNPVFENSQAAHRAEWGTRVGPWREGSYGLEDWDMWLRLADAGARFRTVSRPTVMKTMGTTNRHRSLPQVHSVELVSFPDGASARRGLAALSEPGNVAELGAASEADALDWYRGLAQTDGFVFPAGFAMSRSEALEKMPSAMHSAREADRGLEDPVTIRLERRGDRVAVVQRVGCMTEEHALRYRAMACATRPRQFASMQRALAAFGGVVCADDTTDV